MPTPRRRPWGQLWADAPWDGKARPPAPVRAPLTEAALIDTPPPRGTLSLRRRAWGKLFQAVPWERRPIVPPLAPTMPPPATSPDAIEFCFTPTGEADETSRLAPQPLHEVPS
ncbi:MAG: hypothetical protein MUF18_09565 [Fimbriiglobus sp.]|jgi:hypothetical protein|nr:hypothetical protein [Fimbriiglobus sp.]